MELTEFRLTVLGAMITIILAGAVLLALGDPVSMWIPLAAPTLVALLAVFRGEQNARQNRETGHKVDKLVSDNQAFRAALEELQKPKGSVQRAARIAVEHMPDLPKDDDESSPRD